MKHLEEVNLQRQKASGWSPRATENEVLEGERGMTANGFLYEVIKMF